MKRQTRRREGERETGGEKEKERRREEVGSIAKRKSKRVPEERTNPHLEGRGAMAESGVNFEDSPPLLPYFGASLPSASFICGFCAGGGPCR